MLMLHAWHLPDIIECVTHPALMLTKAESKRYDLFRRAPQHYSCKVRNDKGASYRTANTVQSLPSDQPATFFACYFCTAESCRREQKAIREPRCCADVI